MTQNYVQPFQTTDSGQCNNLLRNLRFNSRSNFEACQPRLNSFAFDTFNCSWRKVGRKLRFYKLDRFRPHLQDLIWAQLAYFEAFKRQVTVNSPKRSKRRQHLEGKTDVVCWYRWREGTFFLLWAGFEHSAGINRDRYHVKVHLSHSFPCVWQHFGTKSSTKDNVWLAVSVVLFVLPLHPFNSIWYMQRLSQLHISGCFFYYTFNHQALSHVYWLNLQQEALTGWITTAARSSVMRKEVRWVFKQFRMSYSLPYLFSAVCPIFHVDFDSRIYDSTNPA